MALAPTLAPHQHSLTAHQATRLPSQPILSCDCGGPKSFSMGASCCCGGSGVRASCALLWHVRRVAACRHRGRWCHVPLASAACLCCIEVLDLYSTIPLWLEYVVQWSGASTHHSAPHSTLPLLPAHRTRPPLRPHVSVLPFCNSRVHRLTSSARHGGLRSPSTGAARSAAPMVQSERQPLCHSTATLEPSSTGLTYAVHGDLQRRRRVRLLRSNLAGV